MKSSKAALTSVIVRYMHSEASLTLALTYHFQKRHVMWTMVDVIMSAQRTLSQVFPATVGVDTG